MTDMGELNLPAHGGDLQWAQQHFGGVSDDWLDLSTGISPWSWPVPALPAAVWQRLPPTDDAYLRLAAAEFYGCSAANVLPVPGSQFAISLIPKSLAGCCVAVPDPGYHEHATAWREAGHQIIFYRNQQELAALIEGSKVQSAVVINPNNPTCEIIDRDKLIHWHSLLQKSGGLLLVDEAFGDLRPEQSLSSRVALDNLVVLRSVGKFFGLAGLRLGFVVAAEHWLATLSRSCSPWQVSHPAMWVGRQALLDRAWQNQQRLRLTSQSSQLQSLLQTAFPETQVKNGGLFVTLFSGSTPLYPLFLQFARQNVLLRYGRTRDEQDWLRFGLPGASISAFGESLAKLISPVRPARDI